MLHSAFAREACMYVSVVVGAAISADWFFQPRPTQLQISEAEIGSQFAATQASIGLMLSAASLSFFDGYREASAARPRSHGSAADVRPNAHPSKGKPRRVREEYYWIGPTKGEKSEPIGVEPLTHFAATCVAGCYGSRGDRRHSNQPKALEQAVQKAISSPSSGSKAVLLTIAGGHSSNRTRSRAAPRRSNRDQHQRCGRRCQRVVERKARRARHADGRLALTRYGRSYGNVRAAGRRPHHRGYSIGRSVPVDTRRYFDNYRPAGRHGSWGWAR